MPGFDDVAGRYDAFCQTPLGHFVDAVERELIEATLEPRAGESVADLGCGTGSYALWLATRGCFVVGVDASSAMLARARAKPPPAAGSILCRRANLSRLPWPDGVFDAALLQVTLEFVTDPAAVLREALRVLRPQGRLVLGLIQGGGPWARHYAARRRRDPFSIYRTAHFWTLPELAALIDRPPAAVRAGLFVGPDEFNQEAAAWARERMRRTARPIEDAGFIAVRYDVDRPVSHAGHGV